MHALIIEDDSLIAALIESVLTDCGFDSFEVSSSAAEAITAAARRCPDLITADVTLASGNGIEAIRLICPDASIPVIFITGGDVTNIRALMPSYAVLRKPFSEQTLTYAVEASVVATRWAPGRSLAS